MGKLKVEDILKPGAKLKARKLTDKEIREAVERCQKAQNEVKERMMWTQEKADAMKKVITI
jgi:hypothetical protein